MAVQPIPEGYHTLTPYLIVDGAERVIEFMKQAFGAEELFRMPRPDGGLWHGEVQIGDSRLMIADSSPEYPPQPGVLYVYVEDADATYARALEAGATSMMEPADQFYGDRHGGVRDVAGNQWWIGTHVEDVPEEEIARRRDAEMAKMTAGA